MLLFKQILLTYLKNFLAVKFYYEFDIFSSLLAFNVRKLHFVLHMSKVISFKYLFFFSGINQNIKIFFNRMIYEILECMCEWKNGIPVYYYYFFFKVSRPSYYFIYLHFRIEYKGIKFYFCTFMRIRKLLTSDYAIIRVQCWIFNFRSFSDLKFQQNIIRISVSFKCSFKKKIIIFYYSFIVFLKYYKKRFEIILIKYIVILIHSSEYINLYKH